ncbi:thioredoxin family protein [Singulisphaera sp. Ch08]|uniref:Thioredoxin family protein n=1 Tax=Singulisphaera sp. Ch08 TaxID=3120278 RepID=A0AAU7CKX0_9BACT
MKFIVFSAMLVALTWLTPPPVLGGEAWSLEFEESQAAAKAQGKDMLIDFGGSDWCLPCRWLKDRVFSKPEFVERAGREFVLVDIDLPMTNRIPISADRKQRYEKLQKRYGITTFPTVVLATPDGRPYARTTYREAIQTPEAYWKYLEPLRERGRRLSEALTRAETLQGRERAEALADGLAEVDPRFVPRFYGEQVAALRAAALLDPTGYLGFLDGRRALDEFQADLDLRSGAIDPAAVDTMIDRVKLRGESFQEAMVLRAAGEVLAGEDRRALRTLAAVLDAQPTRTRFDRGDFVPLDAATIAMVRRRITEGEAESSGEVALYYALHRIFEFDMPNPYEVSCGGAFRPNVRVREVIGDRYGRALIRSTEGLRGEARARALAKGLEGTFFPARGSIREIVIDLVPSLVGKETAKAILPVGLMNYTQWID